MQANRKALILYPLPTQPRDLVVFLTGKITSIATRVALLEPRSVILTKQCILYLVIVNLKPNIPKI